jgi:uncharacterized glyoxalase superfamily protein PhnB
MNRRALSCLISMTARVMPNLGYRDAPRALRFLVEAFGFTVVERYDREGGAVGYARLRWPGGGGVTAYSAEPGTASVADHVAGSGKGYPAFSVHVETDRPDELFTRAVAHGAKVVQPIHDSAVGTRGFVVRDPEGLTWSFGTPLPKLVRDARGEWRPRKPSSARKRGGRPGRARRNGPSG